MDTLVKEETLAMGTFPIQSWCEPMEFGKALEQGTIFPCLVKEVFFATQESSQISKLFQNEEEKDIKTRLNEISFAINDLTLFLDTHDKCEQGLQLMKELLQKRMDLLAEYTTKEHPLTMLSMITGEQGFDEFGWTRGPAPWEGDGCICGATKKDCSFL